jgi:excisionase family DNA binding protein
MTSGNAEAAAAVALLDRLTVRVPEAAQLLSISRAAVYRLLSGGEIEAAKSGQKTMVIVASIKAFVERNRVAVQSARATL